MKNIFEPVALRNITIKNAAVRSATDEHQATPDGHPTELLKDIYGDLAMGGVGLVITGHLFVSYPLGQSNIGQCGIYDDSFIEPLSKIALAGKKNGAKIIAQISHAGAKHKASNHQPVSSADISGRDDRVVPKPLGAEEIKQIIQDFSAAALRAKEAGFDGVQVHCAHSYLLSEFVDPFFNKRSDEYGGIVENRMRLPSQIIKKIKAVCGEDYPIFVKINSNTTVDNDAYGQDLVEMVRIFDSLGVEAVELSGVVFAPNTKETLYFLDRAAFVRSQVNIPIILVGGIRSSENIEKAFAAGIDMVSFSRPFAAQPDLVNQIRNGNWVSPCVSCNKCFTRYASQKRECAVFAK